jgi:hypothetical protein
MEIISPTLSVSISPAEIGADETLQRALKHADIVLSCPQHQISSPDPEYAVKKGDGRHTRPLATWGGTVVLFRRRKRRPETAELLRARVDKHPTGTIFTAWDRTATHAEDAVEAVVRAAAGRLVLRY